MWKQGPLPKDTWNWGAVVIAGNKPSAGFQFADFCGDHVKLCPSDEIVPAERVGWYDNSIELPSGVATCRAPS